MCVIGGGCCQEREKVALDDHAKVALNDIATGQKSHLWGICLREWGSRMVEVPKKSSRSHKFTNGELDELVLAAMQVPSTFAPIRHSQAGTSFPGVGVRTPVARACSAYRSFQVPGVYLPKWPEAANSIKFIDRERSAIERYRAISSPSSYFFP